MLGKNINKKIFKKMWRVIRVFFLLICFSEISFPYSPYYLFYEIPEYSFDFQVGPSYFSPVTKELNGIQLNKMSGYSLAFDWSLRESRTISSQRLRLEYNNIKDKIFNQKLREYDIGYKFFTKLAGSGKYDFKKSLIVGIGPGVGILKLENIKKEQVKGNIYYLEGDIIKYFYYKKTYYHKIVTRWERNPVNPTPHFDDAGIDVYGIAISIGLRIKWNINGDIRGFLFSPALGISLDLP